MRLMQLGLAGVVVAAFASSAALASDGSLEDKVQQLESLVKSQADRIQSLEAERGDDWMNTRRAEEVKQLVREVLSDSETRASLMDSSITAGHNGENFFLSSGDGKFDMTIHGQLQVRYMANFRDQANGSTIDQGENGFQISRAKVGFEGTVINPRVHFALRLAMGDPYQHVITDKVVIGYDLTDDLHIWAGEDTAPFMREELISSARQLAVERSLVNEAFSMGIVQGLGLRWDAHEQVKIAAMIHDGARSGEGSFFDVQQNHLLDPNVVRSPTGFGTRFNGKDFEQDNTDFAVAARADVLLAGDWQQWQDFTSWPGDELFVYAGAAINYDHAETGDRVNRPDILSWTVDIGAEYQGFSLFAAYVGTSIAYDDGVPSSTTPPGIDDFDPWGVVIQGAYNIDLGNQTSLEPFIRYEYMNMDDWGNSTSRVVGQGDDASLITFGANWYHAKHSAKLTADIVWALDPLHSNIPGTINNTGGRSQLGLLQDDTGQEDQVVVRLQYQLLF